MTTWPTRATRAVLLVGLLGGCQMMTAIERRQAVDHYVEGQLLADQGDLDAALAELARAVRTDPNLSVAHSAIGDIHRKRGDNALARVSYRKACDTNPYAFRPHYNLGVVCQVLSATAETVSKAEAYLREAVEVYLRATTLEPEDFDTNLNLGACYYSLGKYTLAEKYCKAAIALRGDSAEAHSNLGIIYDSQGRLYEAIKAYKDSLEIDVHQPKLLMNLGSTYLRQGRLDSAMRAFEMAAREDPDSADAWAQLGTCHYRRKEYDEALSAYLRAVELDDASAAAHRGLGVVYMTQYLLDRTEGHLKDKALASWHRSLEIEPDQEDVLALVRKYGERPTGPEL